ncbi:hypothetical protein AB9K26_11270 [Psychroserpens sp. XS_ASV72]|uniref:hypothetical protein n=1 Tax=Psychroserpens sp. XS_ASV72 TaxID=3241293 RepID=UPI0035186994
MKRYLLNFIATIIIAVLLSQVLPWWSVMLAGLITGLLIPLKRSAVFFVPFLAVALFWMVYAYSLSQANDFILSKKIAELLPLNGNPYLLLLLTGIIGGIATGIAAVLGKQISILLKSSKS